MPEQTKWVSSDDVHRLQYSIDIMEKSNIVVTFTRQLSQQEECRFHRAIADWVKSENKIKQTQLDPCPLCASGGVCIIGTAPTMSVKCTTCGLTLDGQDYEDKEDLAAKWNMRRKPQECL